MRRCLSGKHRHASEGAAEAQLRALVRRRPDYKGRVYFCPSCSGYHVGRRKAKKD